MIKKIFFILVLFCFLNPCLADDNAQIAKAQKKADKTVNQIKEFREDIYGSLNLTQQQRTEIDTIDGVF